MANQKYINGILMAGINTSETPPFPLSESVQMYLVTIARLRRADQPVPLSQLADTISISPVSANEMCRKLQDQGLVVYQPYRGVSLTDEGEQRACYILRRHRLWEVLLVERLGFEYSDAHDVACQLEHATPDSLADRLDLFLDYPPTNPVGEPIPRCDGRRLARSSVTLAALAPGQRGQVIRCELAGAPQSFLNEQGIRPGIRLEVIAAAGDGLLIQAGQTHVALARSLAEAILVEPETAASKPSHIILDVAFAAGIQPGPTETPEPIANHHMEEKQQ